VLTEREILAYIGRQPRQQASFKQMLREMGVRGQERQALKDELSRLAREGTLVESRGQYFSLARGGNFVSGRLLRHRDGYGFVIPDERPSGIAGDIYVDAFSMHDAMHGDRVLARIARVDERGRAEGKIQKVLERAHATVVGRFRAARGGDYVVPSDERLHDDIVIPPSQPLPGGLKPVDIDDAIVDVEITRFPSATARAEGRVLEVLGRPGDFGIDVEIIIRKHHLPHRFPAAVLGEAEGVPQFLSSRELLGRRDFRGLPMVTIDGETARDFDDAVHVERLANGNCLLHVHIADVAHYVFPGRPLDLEARLRGTSVYFPDRALPMLPFELSNGICSLNPGVDRLVMSCLMEIDATGQVVRYELGEGVIRSAARMTYTSVHLVLEGDPGLRRHYAALAPGFELMKELALVLNEKRRKRGSIDFDLPEAEIEFDEFGQMRAITRSERNIAHRIIEEFMLAANETVAGHLDRLGIASLYRIHEKPDPRRVMEFEEIAASFGHSLGIGGLAVKRLRLQSGRGAGQRLRFGRERGPRFDRTLELPAEVPVSPHNYQRLADNIAGKPEERILSYLMLRSLKQARYGEQNAGHFALAAPVYTHFTSPIRRYPDLIVHRVLKAVLGGWKPEAPRSRQSRAPAGARPGPIPEAELKLIAEETSDAERRAQDAERELLEWKKVEFMAQHVGEEFDGLVVHVTSFGFFVELTEMFIEGLVPVSSLIDDRYFFRETTMEWVGERTKRRFALGSRVRVVVDRVDPLEHKINFALA
jgi:ribonuclease R